MLRKAKLLTLQGLQSLGVFDVLMRSNWRRRRLLILCYHGISQHDEHLWNPNLYMSPATFRGRLELLKRSGCNVIPLDRAVELLLSEKLPEKSVVLTFDDGFSSFYNQAFSILKEYGFPATVYLTSYYSAFNKPVFDVMCSYLLWKGKTETLAGDEFNHEGNFDLQSEEGRSKAALTIRIYARDKGMSALQKDQLLTQLAERLNVDYESILAKRLLHLLSPAEVAQLAAEGVNFELHTHRHCVPTEREFFISEVEENKAFIRELTASSPSHFCYPSGVHGPQYFPFLREASVVSGVTCEIGLASRTSHVLALPRLTDTNSLQAVEFEGWLCGAATFLPRRQIHDDEVIYPYYY